MLKKIRSRLRDAYWDVRASRIKVPSGIQPFGTTLFLCRGNICRSPFAEKYARLVSGDRAVTFLSAGIEVTSPNPPPDAACEAAKTFGVRMDEHRSQPLTAQMMRNADAIFVMEIPQLRQLKRQYPAEADKIYPLALLQDGATKGAGGYEKYNIPDPYGGLEVGFSRCYQQISRCIDSLLKLGDLTGLADAESVCEAEPCKWEECR